MVKLVTCFIIGLLFPVFSLVGGGGWLLSPVISVSLLPFCPHSLALSSPLPSSSSSFCSRPFAPLCPPPLFQIYLLAPKSALGSFIKKPFIKFICHTASYLTFLFLLLLASQHIARTNLHMQGPPPTVVEWMILPWVLGKCKSCHVVCLITRPS